jgi:glycosyltransferase involved in cell wall biosynthesis
MGSFIDLNGNFDFEIVIVEDGSNKPCDTVISEFEDSLTIRYFMKANSGPGDSRNFGMKQALSDFFIILDSDVLLHPDYLIEVDAFLKNNAVDCIGGPDGASEHFTKIQKAINYSMTSFLTTGGVRGSDSADFQPRSFNMGLSRKAFEATNGFDNIHPGEDPDLVIRLWEKGYKTAFVPKALVYHKRRINWALFLKQVFKFGSVRPILNKRYPKYQKLSFWLPSLFLIGFIGSFVAYYFLKPYTLYAYVLYFIAVLLHALVSTRSVLTSLMAVFATCIQLFGYGFAFLRSTVILKSHPNKEVSELFPNLFFK